MTKYLLLCAALVAAAPTLSVAQTRAHASAGSSAGTSSNSSLSEAQKVQQLIAFVRGMHNATFIRNGSAYNCEKAADHLLSKWEKHNDEVHTAEGFIDKLASKSGFTGKDYLIRFADGRTATTSEVLHRQLKLIEQK